MQSKKSYFSAALFKKNALRFWPIWATYLVILAFAMPLQLLTTADYGYMREGAPYARWFADSAVLEMSGEFGLVLVVGFSILAAMAVFSYLHFAKSAGMIHALPVRREGLFLTNYLSGLAFLVGPSLVIFLLTLLAEAAVGAVNAGALCMWLVVHLLLCLFFYSFAVLCGVASGNLLAMPVFYGVLNFLFMGVFALVDTLLRAFLFGYTGVAWMSTLAEWLTPALRLMNKLRLTRQYDELGELVGQSFMGLPTALFYALVGVAFAVIALVIYRKRQLETAGDVVAVSWLRPIFKYGVSICVGYAGGLFLFEMFGRRIMQGELLPMLAFILPCGAVGYFAAEMLLQKSFRVFKRWKGCPVVLVCMAAALLLVSADPFGFQNRVPGPEEVETVTVCNIYSSPRDAGDRGISEEDDEAIIAAARSIHGAIVANREKIENGTESSVQTRVNILAGTEYVEVSDWDYRSIQIIYQLKNGRQMERNYQVEITQAMLDDPTSYAAQMQDLLSRPERMVENYFFYVEKGSLAAVELKVYDTVAQKLVPATVEPEGRAPLLAAVKADMEAGHMGRYLLDNEARLRNCYYNDLSFGFYMPREPGDNTPRVAAAYDRPQATRAESQNVTVTLQTGCSQTLAELTRQGILDETHRMMTQAEGREAEAKWNAEEGKR